MGIFAQCRTTSDHAALYAHVRDGHVPPTTEICMPARPFARIPFSPSTCALSARTPANLAEDIRDLRRTLLPDRRVPPKIILPKDLRKVEEAKLAQISAISSDY